MYLHHLHNYTIFESKTRGYEDTAEKQARFQKTISPENGVTTCPRIDPYYNPNLTHAREGFCDRVLSEMPQMFLCGRALTTNGTGQLPVSFSIAMPRSFNVYLWLVYDRRMDVTFWPAAKPTQYQQDPRLFIAAKTLSRIAGQVPQCRMGHSLTWRIPPSVGCVVVHRPRVSFRLWRLVRRLKSMGTRLVADLDDLVFDESLAEYSPAVRNGREPLVATTEVVQGAPWCKSSGLIVTVSWILVPACASLFPSGKPVTVVHNAVHCTGAVSCREWGRNAQSARRVPDVPSGTRHRSRFLNDCWATQPVPALPSRG